MWTIELWHASGRNTGSTGENPVYTVGEGGGGLLVRVQHPRSFRSPSFSAPFLQSLDLASSFDPDGV